MYIRVSFFLLCFLFLHLISCNKLVNTKITLGADARAQNELGLHIACANSCSYCIFRFFIFCYCLADCNRQGMCSLSLPFSLYCFLQFLIPRLPPMIIWRANAIHDIRYYSKCLHFCVFHTIFNVFFVFSEHVLCILKWV